MKESIAFRGDSEGEFFTFHKESLWVFRVDEKEESHWGTVDRHQPGKFLYPLFDRGAFVLSFYRDIRLEWPV